MFTHRREPAAWHPLPADEEAEIKRKKKTDRQPISVAPVKGRPPASPFALQAVSSPRSALLRTDGCSKLHRTFSLRRRPAGPIPFYSIHTKKNRDAKGFPVFEWSQ